MARISKYKLTEEVLDKLFSLFFEIVGNHDNKSEFGEIIKGLFSYNERIMFAKRVAVIYLLLKNIDFKNICMALNVSSATVAKFKLLIENKQEDALIQAFDGIIFSDKARAIIDDFFNSIFRPGKYGIDWKLAWGRKRESERKKQFGI